MVTESGAFVQTNLLDLAWKFEPATARTWVERIISYSAMLHAIQPLPLRYPSVNTLIPT